MVPGDLLDNDDWDGITALAKEAMLTMLNIEIKHIGINSDSEEDCRKNSSMLASILNQPTDEHKSAVFAGTMFEVMKGKGIGTHGHIGLSVTSVDRAITFFESQGFEFNKDSITYDEEGKAKFVYFKDEIGGFGVHLVNK